MVREHIAGVSTPRACNHRCRYRHRPLPLPLSPPPPTATAATAPPLPPLPPLPPPLLLRLTHSAVMPKHVSAELDVAVALVLGGMTVESAWEQSRQPGVTRASGLRVIRRRVKRAREAEVAARAAAAAATATTATATPATAAAAALHVPLAAMAGLPANSTVVYASLEFNADYEHNVVDPPDTDNPWRNGPVIIQTRDAHSLFSASTAFTLPPRDGVGPRLVLPQRAPRTDYVGPANPKKKLPKLLLSNTSGTPQKGGTRRKVHGCGLETVGLTAAGEALAAEKYQPVLVRAQRACLCGAWTFEIELTARMTRDGRFQMTVTSCAAPGAHGPECRDAFPNSRVTATQHVALRVAAAHPCVTASKLANGTSSGEAVQTDAVGGVGWFAMMSGLLSGRVC